MKTYNLMTREVVTLQPGTTLKEAARLFIEHGISGAPVVDEKGAVVGVLSESDIVLAADQPDEPHTGRLLDLLFGDRPSALEPKLHSRTAADAMTSPAVTVPLYEEIWNAAALMRKHEVNRLPVVDERGTPVGILSRGDLLRAFTRDDEEIAKDIRRDAVLNGIYANPRAVDVKVEDGEVMLIGEVESRGKAERLAEFTERIPGVVGVTSQLTWRTDKRAPRGITPSH